MEQIRFHTFGAGNTISTLQFSIDPNKMPQLALKIFIKSQVVASSNLVLPCVCLISLPFGSQGRVECWDPRVRNRVGILDCALSSLPEGAEYVPSC